MENNRVWVGTAEIAQLLGVTRQRVCDYLRADRVLGAYKVSNVWIIPLYAGQPVIRRCKKGPKTRWTTRRKPPLQRIHVNQEFLRYNSNHPHQNPVPIFAVETYKDKVYADRVIFNGPSTLVHRPQKNKGLKCGAKAWLETYEPLELIGQTTYAAIAALISSE